MSTAKPDKSKISLAILISGRGSNMLAIAKACESDTIHANIDLVISNRPDAKGIALAQEMGLATSVIDHTTFSDRQHFDSALHQTLQTVKPDWIILAGFMRVLTANFVNQWQGRILNIHPSLLPLYPGLNTHAQAIEAGDTEAGASVHIVVAELDAGPVVAQVRVPIKPNDTPNILAERVIKQEHALYIKALQDCINKQRLPSEYNS